VRRAATLDALCDEADVLTVHTPLTDETTGMVGRRELSRLPAGAVVVNMARGGIVDEAALLAALQAGLLAGAVLDVYSKEPLTGQHPFRAMPNVVLTPHIGSATRQTREAMTRLAVDNVLAVERGDQPLTPVSA